VAWVAGRRGAGGKARGGSVLLRARGADVMVGTTRWDPPAEAGPFVLQRNSRRCVPAAAAWARARARQPRHARRARSAQASAADAADTSAAHNSARVREGRPSVRRQMLRSADASSGGGRPADKKTDEEASADTPRTKSGHHHGSRWGDALLLPKAFASPLLPSLAPAAAAARAVPRLPPPSSRHAALLLAALLLFLLFAHRFGPALAAHAEPDALRATFESAGDVGGVLLYVVAFCVGELLHMPGMLFVAAGVLVWGCVLRGVCAACGARGRRTRAQVFGSGACLWRGRARVRRGEGGGAARPTPRAQQRGARLARAAGARCRRRARCAAAPVRARACVVSDSSRTRTLVRRCRCRAAGRRAAGCWPSSPRPSPSPRPSSWRVHPRDARPPPRTHALTHAAQAQPLVASARRLTQTPPLGALAAPRRCARLAARASWLRCASRCSSASWVRCARTLPRSLARVRQRPTTDSLLLLSHTRACARACRAAG
jgi:hypothetical protein